MKTVATNKLLIHPKLIDVKSQINFNKMVVIIREFGFKFPIIVTEDDNQLLIVDGVRRWYAAQQLNIQQVPIKVVTIKESDVLIESILRNTTTKRSMREIIEALKVVLGILGSSQGKRRINVNELFKGDFENATGDRFKLAGKILDLDL
ncbi:ParB/RepB/Spo0J family partition protein [Flagellimonas marinaquae]